jgi:hypothetical protein
MNGPNHPMNATVCHRAPVPTIAAATASPHLGEETGGDHRGRFLGGRPGVVQCGFVDPGCVKLIGIVQRLVGHRTDQLRLVGDASDGCDRDPGHQGASRPRTIRPVARLGATRWRWYLLAASQTLALGPLLGLSQAAVLRGYTRRWA